MTAKEIYLTSDTHFGHANVIKYCNRPFSSVEEMDETLIDNWNKTVKPNDAVWHLGDFAFYRDPEKIINILRRLNGNKFLIFGNHDKIMRDGQINKHFSGSYSYHELNVPDPDCGKHGQKIVLCHTAFRVWNKQHYGAWNCFGHSHGTLKDDPALLQLDVGVDCHDYTPISYEQIKSFMKGKTFAPIDHHV